MDRLRQSKEQYLQLGGNRRLIDRLGSSSGIRVEALLKHEIQKLATQKTEIKIPVSQAEKKEKQQTAARMFVYQPNPEFRDYISEYPAELHPVYMRRREAFLEACSMKVQLNALDDREILRAGKLQWEIWNRFKEFDKLNKVLRHYRETRRIMPSQTKEDFSDIPERRLGLKLRNLRSLKTNRKKNIQTLKDNLPDADDPMFKVKFQELNRKLEQLAEIDLQIEKLETMMRV